jgi:hypothetical protein
MLHHRNGSAIRTRHTHPPSCYYLVGRRVRTKLQEACAAEGVGARQADGLIEGLEADRALWHCRSVWISGAGEAGSACSSSTAAEAWHGSWIAGTVIAGHLRLINLVGCVLDLSTPTRPWRLGAKGGEPRPDCTQRRCYNAWRTGKDKLHQSESKIQKDLLQRPLSLFLEVYRPCP